MDRQATRTRSPNRDAAIFVLLTFAISSPLYFVLIERGKLAGEPLAGLLAWIPTLVGLLLSWWMGYGRQGLGAGWTSTRAFALAAGVPVLAVLASYLALALTGNGSLRWPLEFAGTIGALAAFTYGSIGEEFGWRGFFAARLREAGVELRWLVIGLVWSAWHYPLIFSGLSAASSSRPWISAALFTVTTTSFGVLLGWLRERYGSVWPVVVSHAVHNVAALHLGPTNLVDGPHRPYLVGDSGVFLAVPYTLIAIYLSAGTLGKNRHR